MIEGHGHSPPVAADGRGVARSPGANERISTAEMPSTSSRNSRTFSSSEDGTFLPTKSARMGSLPVPAVDQDRKLHAGRAPDVHQRVERGADGAPGEQHVVDEDDVFIVERCGDVGLADGGAGVHRRPVVPVQVDVQRAEGQPPPKLVFQRLAEADGEVDPAPLDASRTVCSQSP